MKPKNMILRDIFHKYLFHRHLFENDNAENLQDFAQTQLDLEFFLDNCDQDINADGNPCRFYYFNLETTTWLSFFRIP